MIQINLLDPAQMKGRARAASPGGVSPTGAGSAIVTFAVIFVLAVNGVFGLMSWQRLSTSRSARIKVEDEYKRVKAEIESKTKDAENVRKFREVVANQMDVLRSLDPPNRILWSQKINMLASLIPPDVFVDDVRINEDVQMVETEASKAAIETWKKNPSNKKGPQPKPVMRPVIKYHLVLSGLAMGKDNIEQFNNVMAFQRALNEYKTVDASGAVQHFMDGFQREMQFDVIKGEVYEQVPVNKFVFKLNTLPLGEEQKKAAAETRVASAGR